jgi:tetratricopeptide (TPR) repeat protein
MPAEQRNAAQRNAIRNLAASVHELGQIQKDKDDPACDESYHEAFGLADAVGDKAGQANIALNLGNAYMDIDTLCDFDVAEQWLKKSLELCLAEDALVRGKSLNQLGKVALLRFDDASKRNLPEEDRLRFLNDAARYYQAALRSFPPTAIVERAVTHNQLGTIFGKAGDTERALQHFQQDIRYSEQTGDIFGAGLTRYNVAIALLSARRFDDARAYAQAALANFKSFGGRAAADIEKTERLLAFIDQAEAEQRGKS